MWCIACLSREHQSWVKSKSNPRVQIFEKLQRVFVISATSLDCLPATAPALPGRSKGDRTPGPAARGGESASRVACHSSLGPRPGQNLRGSPRRTGDKSNAADTLKKHASGGPGQDSSEQTARGHDCKIGASSPGQERGETTNRGKNKTKKTKLKNRGSEARTCGPSPRADCDSADRLVLVFPVPHEGEFDIWTCDWLRHISQQHYSSAVNNTSFVMLPIHKSRLFSRDRPYLQVNT